MSKNWNHSSTDKIRDCHFLRLLWIHEIPTDAQGLLIPDHFGDECLSLCGVICITLLDSVLLEWKVFLSTRIQSCGTPILKQT